MLFDPQLLHRIIAFWLRPWDFIARPLIRLHIQLFDIIPWELGTLVSPYTVYVHRDEHNPQYYSCYRWCAKVMQAQHTLGKVIWNTGRKRVMPSIYFISFGVSADARHNHELVRLRIPMQALSCCIRGRSQSMELGKLYWACLACAKRVLSRTAPQAPSANRLFRSKATCWRLGQYLAKHRNKANKSTNIEH